MSVAQFRKDLKNYVEKWCTDNDQDSTNSKSLGMAFEDFVFDTLVNRYELDGVSKDENIFRTNDKQFDILLPPSGNSDSYIVCQCEMGGIGNKKKSLHIDKMTSWFKRLTDLQSEDWLTQQDIHMEVKNQLHDLKEHINTYKPVKWIYATNKNKHKNSDTELSNVIRTHSYETLYPNVELLIYAQDELKDLYLETQKIEMPVPAQINFQHAIDKGIFDASGRRFFIGLISAEVIAEWYKSNGEALFSQNIRTLLTKNRINKEMAKTLKEQPANFRYYNNGISAICEKLEYNKLERKVQAHKFSVINGAQTVGTIAGSRGEGTLSDVEVLLKITEVEPSNVLGNEITKFNNTQNSVKSPDFRSNDEIQIWLEKKFDSLTYPSHFRKIAYRRKRPYSKGKANELVLSLIEFGKIRRSYIKSSSEQNSKPDDIWKTKQEGGCYEDIFPVSGMLDSNDLIYSIFMCCIYLKIEEYLNVEKKCNGDTRKSLTRMVLLGVEAFHMFWQKYCDDFTNYQKIGMGEHDSDEVFQTFWLVFSKELYKVYDREIVNGSTTAYSFVRSKAITNEVISETLGRYEELKKLKSLIKS